MSMRLNGLIFPSMRSSDLFGRCRGVGLLVAFALVLIGCGGQPKKPDPIELEMQIVAADDLNPDINGRPSPVVVAVYQLAGATIFMEEEFFAVFDPEGEKLAEELLKREQMTLQPGETREYRAEFNPETTHIGVAVAYRDMENAAWRASIQVPVESLGEKINIFSTLGLKISVDALAVSMSESKS